VSPEFREEECWYLRAQEVCPEAGSRHHASLLRARSTESLVTMKPKTSSNLAWAVGIASIAMMAGGLVLMFANRRAALLTGLSGQWTFSDVLNNAVNMVVPIIGVVLASRRPQNRIGWLFLVAGFALGLSSFATSYGFRALVADPGSLPAGRAFAWVGNWIGLLPLAMLSLLFLLFPTGRLASPRWRPVAWFVGGAFAAITAVLLFYSTTVWNDPFGQSSSGGPPGFWLWIILPFLGALVASLTAVVVRFTRSVGDERLQLKWFVTAAVLVVVTTIVGSASNSPVLTVLSSLALVFLYSAIGIAVLKYRLYEIDVVISKTVIYGVLAAFFTTVYVAVVVGIGTLIGSTHNPFLTLLAAAVIALAFNPVRLRATRLANRIVYGQRASPYEVLSEFSESMAGTYSVDDVLPQMAKILGEGTGAQQARVWLHVGSEMRAAASWGEPEGADEPLPVVGDEVPDVAGASKVVAVRYRDELLGALTVTKPPNEPLSAAEGKLVDDLAGQAGLVLRNVRLTEELRANLQELRASRQRLVTAQDEARRRLERNIHDGAQQQLVSLSVKLRLALGIVEDPGRERAMLMQLQTDASEALENLRDLARGIYPPLLADQGLVAALSSQARKAAVPVEVSANGLGRYSQEVEAAVYFCCLEALQNVAKYSGATSAKISLTASNGHLSFAVTDDGHGFDPATTVLGTGLQGMADRLDALGGAIEIHSEPGAGTTVAGSMPTAP
jgi:signal transduction histidine kinase